MSRSRALIALVGLLCAVLATGCTAVPEPVPVPSRTPTTPAREFTIGTTEKVSTFDPVAVTDAMGTSLTAAVYQRLMTTDQGKAALFPDAAKDCLFVQPAVYECTLKEKLAFHNWDPLTSSDVKFSINRALRLGVPGSSAVQLAALDHIETPDDLTVRFVLKWPDAQFGFALASPAASIVDEAVYDPDAVLAAGRSPIGSGPFRFLTATDTSIDLRQYTFYKGYTPAAVAELRLRTFPDSAALETAMRSNAVDVVWRGLNDAALKRFGDQIGASRDKVTESGFRREVLPGVRLHFLVWNATSAKRLDVTLRAQVSQALQDARTSGSIIPSGVAGHVEAFPLGGAPSLPPAPGPRASLTLSYTSAVTGERERARDIRDRIESAGYASVQVVADDATADLRLVDMRAWTATPFAWMQLYRDNAPPGSAAKVAELEQWARSTTDMAARDRLLAEVQLQAAADMIVLPISQEDDTVFYAGPVKVHEPRFGPGWQLALWSVGLQ